MGHSAQKAANNHGPPRLICYFFPLFASLCKAKREAEVRLHRPENKSSTSVAGVAKTTPNISRIPRDGRPSNEGGLQC
jgi:hypothetical protein